MLSRSPRMAALLAATALTLSLHIAAPASAGINAAGQEAAATTAADVSLEKAKMLRDTALKSPRAFQFLEDLTTEIGPRLAGTPAEHRAADWAEAKMKATGFDKVWREKVDMRVWQRKSESVEVQGASEQSLTVTALGYSVSTPKGGVTADVVHFDTIKDLQEANPADVKGKIAFISNRMERSIDGSGYGPAVGARFAGSLAAAEKGAVAVLIRSIGTDSHRLPHTGSSASDTDKDRVAAAALSNPDADQLVRLLARGPVSLKVDIQTEIADGHTYNIIGEVTGSSKPDEYVVVGSHLDSWDLGTGAIDDGAGVALNLATASLYADMPKSERPARTLRVILFGAEELGLIGARAYAATHADELSKIAVAAESDFGAGKIWALASRTGASAVPIVDKMAQLLGPLGVVRSDKLASGGPDVGQLRAGGVPVVDLLQNGTDYFDLHHTADDTLDKVSPTDMQQNLAAWAVFTYLAADWDGDFRAE